MTLISIFTRMTRVSLIAEISGFQRAEVWSRRSVSFQEASCLPWLGRGVVRWNNLAADVFSLLPDGEGGLDGRGESEP